VTSSRIAELLDSYIVGLTLPPVIYDQLSAYLELLLRWNAKTNLTSIRGPEQIVTRHFGESLFAAGVLFGVGSGAEGPVVSDQQPVSRAITLADVGSGAGFPGLPIKLAFPELHVTLIESQNKKATFLKEVIRALRLENVEVYSGRAEHWGKTADAVTLRAVERFNSVLPEVAKLVASGGRLCLLIGTAQRSALASSQRFEIKVEKVIPNRPDSLVVVGSIV